MTDRLTPRELDVLRLMCAGKSTKEIAHRLNIAVRTVEIHRAKLRKRTGCRNACELGVWAERNGFASADGWSPVQECTKRILGRRVEAFAQTEAVEWA